MDKSIEELIKEETEDRLKEMSSPAYVFPPKADRKDYCAILAAIVLCGILVLLCMTGVIA